MKQEKTTNKEKIKTKIAEFIRKHPPYSSWYVGITKDIDDRLFRRHRVSRENDLWIWGNCYSDRISRELEKYFVAKGCDGGPCGGDYRSKYIYAYKKTKNTIDE